MANKRWLISIFLFLHCSITRGDVTNILAQEKEVLDNLLNSTTYDMRIRPLNNSNVMAPTMVTVTMYILMASRVDDARMQYNAQFYLRQSWKDPRLKFDNLGGKLKSLFLFEDKIWTPDLFIVNERSGYINSLMKPNKFIRIFPDGTVLYSARVTVILSCPMNFKSYPFDTQVCNINFESYGFTNDDVLYQWSKQYPVGISKDISFSHYTMILKDTKTQNDSLITGNYTRLSVQFYLSRKFMYIFLHLFLPTMFMVVASWIPFWLDHQFVLTRLFVALLTLIVLGSKVSDFNASLPPVSYTKFVDIWTEACMMFVFLSMIEVVIVDYRWRQLQKKQRRAVGVLEDNEEGNLNAIDLKPLVSRTSSDATENFQHEDSSGRLRKFFSRSVSSLPTGPKRIDIISRYLFPATFIIFNMFYWFCSLIV